MLTFIYNLRHYLEKRGYYVCSRLAERMGMRAKTVRISFIYLTFATLGIGFALYLFLAFWLRIKDLMYAKRSSVFDL